MIFNALYAFEIFSFICFAFVKYTIPRNIHATAKICDRASDPALHVCDHEEHVISDIDLKMYERTAMMEGTMKVSKPERGFLL